MKKRIAISLALVALCLGIPFQAASQKPLIEPTVSVDALMLQKLQSAQALLKGLALDDYGLIQRESQRLQLLSLDAGWNTIQTRDYARISTEFRQAANKIQVAGEKRNLDAAGLGYFQLTMTCIDCHRHVRNIQSRK